MRIADATARASLIDGWMTADELRWLAAAATGASAVIEVGSYKGRSTTALACSVRPGGVVYAVDKWDAFDGQVPRDPDEFFHAFMRNVGELVADGTIVPIRCDSLAWDPEDLTGKVDMVFLDGGHTEDRVAAEIVKYAQLLRDGGLLAGHDYGHPEHPGVATAVDRLVPLRARAGYSIWWTRVGRGVPPWR